MDAGVHSSFEFRRGVHRGVVDLQYVDIIDAESLQTCVHRANHMAGDIVQILGTNLYLGVQERVYAKLAQSSAEVRFRGAVTVVGRIVEIVDAKLNGPGNCVAL